jgi:hypothetical protein
MNDKLIANSYIIIDNFITKEQAEFLSKEMSLTYENFPESFNNDSQCPQSLAIYDMWAFVELLLEKMPIISEVIQEPVFPTYSYARIYKKGEELKKHTDRSACELSVTVHLSNDGKDWPIWFETPTGEVVSVNLKAGQAVLYLGCIAPHWRDTYKGTDYRQVFLHYVRARGKNRHLYFDKKK